MGRKGRACVRSVRLGSRVLIRSVSSVVPGARACVLRAPEKELEDVGRRPNIQSAKSERICKYLYMR